MKRQETRHIEFIGVLTLALLLTAPASAVAGVDDPWQLRFYAAAMEFDSSSTANASGLAWDTDVGGGLGISAERRLSPRLGLDLGLLFGGGVDLSTSISSVSGQRVVTSDTLAFTPLTVGLDIHLTPESRVDLRVCPLLAWVRYDDVRVAVSGRATATSVGVDDDLGVGVTLGLDVPFGEGRWSFVSSLTVLDSSMEGSYGDGTPFDSEMDSTIFGIGFGHRF